MSRRDAHPSLVDGGEAVYGREALWRLRPADEHTVGAEEVLNGGALGEELGVRKHLRVGDQG